MPSKNNLKATPEPSPSHTQAQSQSHSYRRHLSKDSIVDVSPFMRRRVLDPKTEQQLRQACVLILQDFKPSDHGMEDTSSKLDFAGPQKRREQRLLRDRNADRPEPKVRMPTGAPVDLKAALEARGLQQTELTLRTSQDARTSHDAPVRANSSRKRAEFGWLDDRDEKRETNLRKYATLSYTLSDPVLRSR
jgi:hypothetical protein